jgi:hypothetical protein
MTNIVFYFLLTGLTVVGMIIGKNKFKETGHELWALFIFFDLVFMLFFGWHLNLAVHEAWL